MKSLSVFIFLLLISSSFAQTTTFSREEERMVVYLNNGWANAQKYDSLKNVIPVLDSCFKFLKKYPRSFAKPNVFSYMLEMTVLVSRDMSKINPLIDSVLFYDRIPATKERIGEILITRNLDIARGRNLLNEALPKLKAQYHIYNTLILLAKSDITLGNYASARVNYENALRIDSTRAEGWYDYLSYLKLMELTNDARVIRKKINFFEKENKLRYINSSAISPNINKNISGYSMPDLESKPFELRSLKGKVYLINCFNFWCGFCLQEFPVLKKLIKEFPEVEFIFLNYGETANELRERYFSKKEFSFLKKQKVLFVNNEFSRNVYGSGVPQTYLIDKSGTIRYDYYGYKEELKTLLRNNILKLIKE